MGNAAADKKDNNTDTNNILEEISKPNLIPLKTEFVNNVLSDLYANVCNQYV